MRKRLDGALGASEKESECSEHDESEKKEAGGTKHGSNRTTRFERHHRLGEREKYICIKYREQGRRCRTIEWMKRDERSGPEYGTFSNPWKHHR